MQISQILSGLSDLTSAGKKADAAAGPTGPKPPIGAGADRGTFQPTAAAAEVLARHDVTDITPLDFSKMIQDLYDAGAISQEELQQLTAIRHDLETAGYDPDESVDLLEFYAEQIEDAQRALKDGDAPAGLRAQVAPLLSRIDWIEKFALIQAAPEAAGLNTLA